MSRLQQDNVEFQNKNYDGFMVIGAGLPRTGTLSLRSALGTLLNGACYHMHNVFEGAEEVRDQRDFQFQKYVDSANLLGHAKLV